MKLLIAAAAMASLMATHARAEMNPPNPFTTDGWYIAGAAGYDSIGKRSLTLNGTPGITAKFKDGFALSGAAGYRWDQGFRTELEISYRGDNVKDFVANSLPWTGTQHDTSFMGNLLFDISTGTNWTPYIGAGIGMSALNWSQFKEVGPTIYDGTDTKLAWQGIVGVGVTVAPRTQVTLDFRYKGESPASYAGSTAGTSITNYSARTRTLMLGFRYAFGGPEPKKTASAPPPPPPPAAPPPPPRPAPPVQPQVEQKFLVFFDFDRSSLRANSQKIVAQAADYAKKNGKTRIIATGHTDTMGTAEYNMALSERRAKAVQKELLKLGIPEGEIDVRWKGKSEPLVQTGDGVKEPQNRRVEIVIE